MKIFISYKQSWLTERELHSDLSIFHETLKQMWHEVFIYYFDADFINRTPKDIIYTARDEITKSDLVLWFVNHSWKSEWMMEELWIAFGLQKNIKLLVNTQFEDEYFLSYGISSDTFLFNSLEDVKDILLNQIKYD
jgi:hypothetical protein